MISIQKYVFPQTPDEAWQLNQTRSNRIIAGNMWLRLSRRPINTAIDLSALGLSGVREENGEFIIGCMTSLRALETDTALNDLASGAFRDALSHIVGVQFRNTATIGGSIYSRFGFSDPLTLLLAMNASATLFKGGRVSLEEYVKMPYDRDLLLDIRVPAQPVQAAFQCMRNTQTDLSVLNCAVTLQNGLVRCAVGARPGRAVLIPGCTEALRSGAVDFGKHVAQNVITGGNMRATAEYRSHLADVLSRRCAAQIGGLK